jgi:hypothetical protein
LLVVYSSFLLGGLMVKDKQGSPVPGFALMGCFASGIAGIFFAFKYTDVLGLFAAALSFGVILFVCFRD